MGIGMTIVFPTLGRGEYLVNAVNDILKQDYRPIEVLIVEQSSELHPSVYKIVNENRELITCYRVGFTGLPRARNFGWYYARYPSVLFLDDDIRCGEDLVTEHLRSQTIQGVGIVGGAVDEKTSCYDNGLPRYDPWTCTPHRSITSRRKGFADHVPGGNLSGNKLVFEKCGGFDETFCDGPALYEETEFCLRARSLGYAVYYNGNARMQHLQAPRGGCRELNIEKYVYTLARNRSILLSRYGKSMHTFSVLSKVILLAAAYSKHYRNFGLIPVAFKGFLDGRVIGKKPRVVTDWSKQNNFLIEKV